MYEQKQQGKKESGYVSTNPSEKVLKDDETIVQSLLNLRDELWDREDPASF